MEATLEVGSHGDLSQNKSRLKKVSLRGENFKRVSMKILMNVSEARGLQDCTNWRSIVCAYSNRNSNA